MIELVVIVPVMFFVILGSVDICNNIFIKQFVTDVSYQGVVQGADASVSEGDLRDSLNAYLQARDIETATIVTQGIDGVPFDDVGRGEAFEVVVRLAAADRKSSSVVIRGVDLSARSVGVRQ